MTEQDVDGWQQQVHRVLEAHGAIIAVAGQMDAVFAAVVNSALIAMPRASGAVIEMLEGQDMVYRAISDGVLQTMVGLRLPVQGSLSGMCLSSSEPQLCRDSETDNRVNREACRATGIRSLVAVPIPAQGVNVGVLKVFSSQPDAFDEQDLLVARLLVAPIACGIANAAQIALAQDHDRLMRRYEATFDQAAVGIVHVAPSGRFLHVNRRFCEITGRAAQELYASTFQDITHPDDLAADLELFAALEAGRIDHYQMEKRYLLPQGGHIWINLTVSMVEDEEGRPDFFVSVVEDISRRKDAESLALRDALTGLPNRRAMVARLERDVMALAEAEAGAGDGMAVAYLDLDHFKQVNDRLGHGVGDECLIAVARAIKGAIRQRDTLYRIAGDEFVLLLPGAGVQDVDRILHRLNRAIAHKVEGTDWKIGISAGAVVLAPGTRTHVKAVLHAADMVMYNAKVDRKSTAHRAGNHLVRPFADALPLSPVH